MGSRAEEEFQAAGVQARRRVVGRNERDLIALAGLAHRDGDRALIGADEGADLVLGDQALGFGAALLRVALVVGEHQLDLGAAQTRQSLGACQRQVEIILVVDDVKRGFIGLLRVDAHLGAGAGKWIEDADDHFGSFRTGRDRRERGDGGGPEQHIAASNRHYEFPC